MSRTSHIIDDIRILTNEVRLRHFEQKGKKFETLDIKSRNQLVTDMDVQVEKELVEGLKEILPEADFLTEEKTIKQDTEGQLKWIIDPIDGTTNFVHGVPAYAISIGLEDREGMLIGIVYELNSQEFFSAMRGNGAFMNGRRISTSDNSTLEDTLIATGFPYFDYTNTAEYLKSLEIFMRRTRGVRRLGSAALDLAYVACGRFDAFYEYSLSPWDVAAGSLLVTEAGGKVCDFNGNSDYIYGKSILAAQKNVFDEVLQIVSSSFK